MKSRILLLLMSCFLLCISSPAKSQDVFYPGKDGTLASAKFTLPSNFKKMVDELSQSTKHVSRGILMELGENQELQKDIEIVPEQAQNLKSLLASAKEKFEESSKELIAFSEMLSKKTNVSQSERDQLAELERLNNERYSRIFEEYEGGVSEILLPHQLKRMNSIAAYLALKVKIPNDRNQLYWPYYLSNALGASEEELKALREHINKADAELKETIATAREKAFEKVMKRVPDSKRDQIKKLMGEKYDFIKSQK